MDTAAAPSSSSLQLVPVVKTRLFVRDARDRPDPEAPLADWLRARDLEVARMGLPAMPDSPFGTDLVPVAQLSDAHLRVLIDHHLRNPESGAFWPADQPVALYGGFWLQHEGQTLHQPHCCGTIGDIHGWVALLDPMVLEGAMPEGHPGLLWRRVQDARITFDQSCEHQPWPENLPGQFTLPMADLRPAIIGALRTVKDLDRRVSALALKTPYADVADRIIWTCDIGSHSRATLEAQLAVIGTLD